LAAGAVALPEDMVVAAEDVLVAAEDVVVAADTANQSLQSFFPAPSAH
jgi:hypothetical protein